MSTEFRTADTDEWICTRWTKRAALDAGCMAFDFGSETRFAALETLALDQCVRLVGEDGTMTTLHGLLVTGTSRALMGRRLAPTFGEFCGTVELGSGELLDRLGLDGMGS